VAANPDAPLLRPAVALLLAVFMIKSAVFPFHFWQPDFHTAAPTPVSAMLSSVVVKMGVYGFLRMTTLLFVPVAGMIQAILLVLGIVGVVLGGLSALGTHNVKRMLAYSTLAQVGFILVGIGWGTPFSHAAALVFAFNHSLIKAAMLMLSGAVASRAHIKSASFDIVTGVGKHMPVAGALFFLGGLALAGIPPTSGFISKLLIFQSGAAVDRWLALVLLALGGLLTLIYTNRAFQRIWWLKREDDAKPKPYGDRLIAPAVLIALVLIFGLWADPLVNFALQVGDWLQTPAAYVSAVFG
jgi:multicomponent Na+:H+ antiporter subunit D